MRRLYDWEGTLQPCVWVTLEKPVFINDRGDLYVGATHEEARRAAREAWTTGYVDVVVIVDGPRLRQ